MNSLDLNEIAGLLTPKSPQGVLPKPSAIFSCNECGTPLENGYCRNDDCEVDNDESLRTYPCNHCGHCPQPDNCVWGVDCPRCNSSVGDLCNDGRGGVRGFHIERHERANTPFYQERLAPKLA